MTNGKGEFAAQAVIVHADAGVEVFHAVVEPQAEPAMAQEAEHAEDAAHAGQEAPHAIVGL